MPDEKFAAMFGADLAGQIDQLANNRALTEKATKDAKERAETDRTQRFLNLVDLVTGALRGNLGRTKLAQDAVGSIQAALTGRAPREAEMAQLLFCEGVIRDAKKAIRNARRTAPAGRGAK